MSQLTPINIRFNTDNDITQAAAGPWSISNTKTHTMVMRFKFASDTGASQFVLVPSVNRLYLRGITGPSKIRIQGANSSGTTIIQHDSTANWVADTWYTVIWSCDTANDKSYLYVNGADQGTAGTLTTDGEVDNTARYWSVGAQNTGINGVDGFISVVAYHDAYYDLSDATVRARFLNSDGTLTDPGIDGKNWFNNDIPRLLWRGSMKNILTNWGIEADFSPTTSDQETCYWSTSDGARRNADAGDNVTMQATSDISFDATNNTIDSAGSNFEVTTPYGLRVGDSIHVSNSVSNDGVYKISTSTAPTSSQITLDSSESLTDEVASAVKVRITRTGRRPT